MKRIDLMTEIRGTFASRRFRQRNFLESLGLDNTKRARKLWNALRRNNAISKTPHKDFHLTTQEKIAVAA